MLKQICSESGATWQEERLTLPVESKEQVCIHETFSVNTIIRYVPLGVI